MNVTPFNTSSSPLLHASPDPNALLLSFQLFLGLWDQHSSLIAQATREEQARAIDLREAYEAYMMAQNNEQMARKFHEALTASISQLELEHARALERAKEARNKHDRVQSSTPSSLLSLLPSLSQVVPGIFDYWRGSSASGETGKREEKYYMEIAGKVSLQLDALLRCLNDLELMDSLRETEESVFFSHTTQRRHLLQASYPPVAKQYYCYPTSSCELGRLSNGVSGFVLNEISSFYLALPVSVGDVNGDGLDDVLTRASGERACVVFGSNKTAWETGLDVISLMDGQRGFVFQHSQGYFRGATADINGDGVADLVLGFVDVYIVFGSRNTNAWGNGTLNLTSLMDGQRGFVLQGGNWVRAAGDINGDGCADIILGFLNPYVVFGSNSSSSWGNGTLNVTSLMDGLRGFALSSTDVSNAGSIGDINGDGVADLLLGQYVIFGSKNDTRWGNGTLDMRDFADGQRGFALHDSPEYIHSISSADVNGDGLADMIIGFDGPVFVVFGSRLPNAWGNGTNTTLASLIDGQRGFQISDGSQPTSALEISAAGDVNGDGIDDFMVGSRDASAPNIAKTGLTYVVFGSNLSNAWGKGVLDLRNFATATRGFVLQGPPEGWIGAGVRSADINGDSLPDLITGSLISVYVVLSNKVRARFDANNLRIASSKTVSLSLHNLSISYDHGADNINLTSFVVNSTSLGYFSLNSSSSVILDKFSMRDLVEGQVRFTHLGGAVAPQYRLCIVDDPEGLSIAVCSDGQIDFLGYPPTLINNQLTVNQGLPTVLQASDLSAFDPDNPDSSELTFLIGGDLSHGNFTATNTSSPALSEFTQQAVINGEIQFNHDGLPVKPSYTVRVNDTKSVTDPAEARITFVFEPELFFTSSAIILDEGQATTLSTLDFNATDKETFRGSIVFEVENVTAGHFAYASNPNYNITSFQQLSLISLAVQFVHDNGSDVEPNFTMRAFDGVLGSKWKSPPQITLNRRPVAQQGTSSGDVHVRVTRGEDFHFSSVRFIDPDAGVNDTLTYRAQLKGVAGGGGSALPPEIRFSPPNQFSGNIRSEGSYNIEVLATDPRGVAGSAEFILSSVDPSIGGINIQQLYTSLSSIGGVGLTVLAYLWLRRRIAKHRRDFPFVNDLRKVLNLEYFDFTRFVGDSYKTQMFAFLLKLQWKHPKFYDNLTPQEQKNFAVCVGEILTKRGLVSRSGYGGGLFGVFCMLNVGWPNELDLRAFEVQSDAIAAEAVQTWREAAASERDYQKPLNRWPYYSPTKREKFCVFCCCAKPASADRWRPTDDDNMTKSGVALTELKARETTHTV